jgi:hypothetical protein
MSHAVRRMRGVGPITPVSAWMGRIPRHAFSCMPRLPSTGLRRRQAGFFPLVKPTSEVRHIGVAQLL